MRSVSSLSTSKGSVVSPEQWAELVKELIARVEALEAERDLLMALMPRPHEHGFQWSSSNVADDGPPDDATCECGMSYAEFRRQAAPGAPAPGEATR